MANYDVLFIHPPAIYDFRKKPIFPGVLGSSVESLQFTKIPLGLLSLAEYLDRFGYKVLIDNLGERMVSAPLFDVEEHIKTLSARVYAVGLHFQWHAQGALEIARLCKKWHPGSLVILGGLTATCFHEEIIRKYEFIDGVVRAEAEKPFLELMKGLEKKGMLTATPNLTYRSSSGDILSASLMAPSRDLDDFVYTRLDLLEPKTSIFSKEAAPRWSLEVCRGCIYNCSICGGSAYTYKTYLGMERPAFRSPAGIVGDIKNLTEQGIRYIGLYQDPRMGGESYWRELLGGLRRGKLNLERISVDLLVPADEEFIREVAGIGCPVTAHICPDTGCDAVRKKLGRHYSTSELLKTIRICHEYHIPVTSFFSTGLAGETRDNIEETWKLECILAEMEQKMLKSSGSRDAQIPAGGPISGPIALDPGSLAFDFPEKYGYRLLYRTLEEYVGGLSGSSWHQWINYETDLLDKKSLVDLILESAGFTIAMREEYGFYNKTQADSEDNRLKADILAVSEIDRIMNIKDAVEKESAIKSLKQRYDTFLNPPIWAMGP
jgi:B12-binding domain/radical SAM domain protein